MVRLGLGLGLRVFWQGEAATLPRCYRLETSHTECQAQKPEVIFRTASTYPLFKGEVRRRAPRVLAGQQSVGVPGAGRVGVGCGVWAGRAHGRRYVAVVVEHGAVAWVWRCRLRGWRVSPAKQRCGSPIHGFVRPEKRGTQVCESALQSKNSTKKKR